MVYAHFVNRVTLSGTMWGGAEQWSTGFFMGEENADADPPNQLMADIIRNKWSDYFQAPGADISNQYVFTQCKVARIQPDGHTEDGSVVYSAPTLTVDGDEATIKLPGQCALVLTLYTDRPRGKASKGRMYLPGIAQMPGNDGKITTTQAATNVALVKTMFDAINADPDVPNRVILAAKGTGPVPALTAQNEPVIGVRLGTVIDTQRRRRNALTEAYSSATLA